MWLNSRNHSGDEDDNATSENVWRFASTTSPGLVGLSGSRKLWNRMELAEEEREEEALPSYLSYLQPPLSHPSSTFASSTFSSGEKVETLNQTIERPEAVPYSAQVEQVTQKSSELAQALEQLVHHSIQRQVGHGFVNDRIETPSACICASLRLEMHEMKTQMHQLQSQVLELTKKTSKNATCGPIASKTTPTWSPHAPPFVPKVKPHQVSQGISSLDPSTATTLSDRISTLEGRQSAFQSHLAQIAKVLNIPMGKAGKQSPVRHLVQSLRDEVERKVQEAFENARSALKSEIQGALETKLMEKQEKEKTDEILSSNAVLAALASEHEASLVRLSNSFETLLTEETRQRTALETRIRSQLEQQEEWLQQLEGAFGSPHHPEQTRNCRDKKTNCELQIDKLLATLERRDDASRDFCQRFARLLVDANKLTDGRGLRSDEDERGGRRRERKDK